MAEHDQEPRGISLSRLSSAAARLLESSSAAGTRTAYASDWALWLTWCERAGVRPLPADPQDVANYLGDACELGYIRSRRSGEHSVPERRRYAPTTLRRWVAAIDWVHRAARAEDSSVQVPGEATVVRKALSGAARVHAQNEANTARRRRQARALVLPDLRRMVEHIETDTWPAGVVGRRDRAMLLIGFAMAARASELVGLNVGDLTWHPEDGVHVLLRVRKNDQEGTGTVQVLPRGTKVSSCAPCALTWWLRLLADVDGDLEASRARLMRAVLTRPVDMTQHVCADAPPRGWGLPPGVPVFPAVHRTGTLRPRASADVVRDVVRRRRAGAGLEVEGYSAHSLRSGAITWAARQGASTSDLQRLSGHRSAEMVEVYRRRETPLEGNAVTRLGM